MNYKDFDINVRVYAYTECTLDDDGEIECAIDTETDFEDVIEYVAWDGCGNSFWAESVKELKALIDKHIEEKGND
jgi:hypothetical protein